MRMEQYIQMIDYCLWEVIENGNSPSPSKTMDGVATIMPYTTTEEKAQRRVELKARSTLLIGIPNEHQLKFNSYKDAKSLWEAIDKRFGGNAATKKSQRNLIKQPYEIFTASSSEEIDQTFDILQKLISHFEIHDGYVDNEGHEVSKGDRKKVATNSKETIGFDKSKDNRNREPMRRTVAVEINTTNDLVAQDGFGCDWSDQAEEGPTNYALKAYTSSSSSSSNSKVSVDSSCSSSCSENVKKFKEQNEQLVKDLKKTRIEVVLKLYILSRDNAIAELRRKLDLAQKEKDGIQLTVENFKNSYKSLSKLIDSQIVDKYKIGLGYHVVPPLYTGNFMQPKPDLTFPNKDEYICETVVSESEASESVVESSEPKTSKVDTSKTKPSEVETKSFSEPLIEDWVSDSEDEVEAKPKIEEKTVKTSFVKIKFVKPKEQVKCPRKTTVNHTENHRQSIHSTRVKNSNFDKRVTTVRFNKVTTARPKAVVSVVKRNPVNTILGNKVDLNEQGVIETGCTRHMTGNMSYLTNYEEIDGGYVAFGVPRKNNMYSVDLKNIVPSGGKFDGKVDEEFFVGYSVTSKAFRVFNTRTKIVEESLHITFLKNKPNVTGNEPTWLFDIDTLTQSTNYEPVVVGNQSNGDAGIEARNVAGQARKEKVLGKDYILLPLWAADPPFFSVPKSSPDVRFKPSGDDQEKSFEDSGKEDRDLRAEFERLVDKEKEISVNNTNNVYIASSPVSATGPSFMNVDGSPFVDATTLPDDPLMPGLEDIVNSDDEEDVGATADFNNLDTYISVSPILITIVHKDHLVEQIIGDLNSASQTRRMTNQVQEHGLVSRIQQINQDFQNCLFACLLSQVEPKKVIQALKDPSWIEAMHDELLQFKLQKVFAPVARIEAIMLFLACASFKDFVVYQMDVKSAFMYGKIEEEVYVCQPPSFEDLEFPDRVYKVEKTLYGLHQAPRAWYETLSTYLLENRFQRGHIDKTLFIKREKSDILLVQVYVDDIIFGFTRKEMCTEFEKMMHKKFQMSSMGELTFFLGLQVKQKEDEIFISQDKLISWQCKKQTMVANSTTEAEYIVASSCRGQEKVRKRFFRDYNTIVSIYAGTTSRDEAVHEEKGDSVEMAATIATSLDAEQESGNINRSQSTAMPNDPLPQGINSSGRPRRQDTMGDKPAQTRFERLSKQSYDSPLKGALEIINLKTRVKKMERKNKSRTPQLKKRIYKARVESSKESLAQQVNTAEVNVAEKEISSAEPVTTACEIVTTASVNPEVITANIPVFVVDVDVSVASPTDDITLAETLMAIKSSASRPQKLKGVVFKEPKLDEKARLEIEKEEEASNVALVKEYDDVQARIDANRQLAKQMQAQEGEQLTIKEKSKLLAEFIKTGRKYFAAKRAEEKRNKPPTKA
uniref:Uncharacterized protein n=1 Tax=Tanacetum cinerariifolium TaxID=118510 RepID=A0A6L2M4H6_TANCI|nr:hypothetical protein [Tanacetum cinerariifolium]